MKFTTQGPKWNHVPVHSYKSDCKIRKTTTINVGCTRRREVRGSGGHERSVWQQAIDHACTAHGECTPVPFSTGPALSCAAVILLIPAHARQARTRTLRMVPKLSNGRLVDVGFVGFGERTAGLNWRQRSTCRKEARVRGASLINELIVLTPGFHHQEKRLKPWIDTNTGLRKLVKNGFEKDYFEI